MSDYVTSTLGLFEDEVQRSHIVYTSGSQLGVHSGVLECTGLAKHLGKGMYCPGF